MDKHKDNGIRLIPTSVLQCSNGKVDAMEKERELYNSVYREISEIIGLEATLKLYLRFKGQQVNFPVRLYNPHLIQKNVVKEFDGSNIPELARKYDYSEKTIRRMIRDSLEESEGETEKEEMCDLL
jgi:Mor family transcriptional regulator